MNNIFSLQQFGAGILSALIVGLIAWRVKALAPSGALGATVLGGLIFGLGGFSWAAVLLTFFISSSLLSKLFSRRKLDLAEKFEKGSRRDWGQVLANGGVGAFIVLLHIFYPEEVWPWLAFAGAMATVNGDTWATEIGVLSAARPRLISTGKVVSRGTSGGVTWGGTAATLMGAALIGLVAILVDAGADTFLKLSAIAVGGLAGATLDSFLGATIQAIYYDPVREKETERVILGEDGVPMKPVRGWDWMNNDMVNFISSIFGAFMVVALWQLFS